MPLSILPAQLHVLMPPPVALAGGNDAFVSYPRATQPHAIEVHVEGTATRGDNGVVQFKPSRARVAGIIRRSTGRNGLITNRHALPSAILRIET
jgi:hypothetical protein